MQLPVTEQELLKWQLQSKWDLNSFVTTSYEIKTKLFSGKWDPIDEWIVNNYTWLKDAIDLRIARRGRDSTILLIQHNQTVYGLSSDDKWYNEFKKLAEQHNGK